MTINVPNPDVLKAGIEHAELDLNAWNQSRWFSPSPHGCGTTACLAGHILQAQGVDLDRLYRRGQTDTIPNRALRALGFSGEYCDHTRFDTSCGDCADDGSIFYRKIFGMIREGIDNFSNDPMLDMDTYEQAAQLRTEPAQFKYFKERITELTGVEL